MNKSCWHGLGKTTAHKPRGEVCVARRVQTWDDVCSLLASPAERRDGRRTRRVKDWDSDGHEAATTPWAARDSAKAEGERKQSKVLLKAGNELLCKQLHPVLYNPPLLHAYTHFHTSLRH